MKYRLFEVRDGVGKILASNETFSDKESAVNHIRCLQGWTYFFSQEDAENDAVDIFCSKHLDGRVYCVEPLKQKGEEEYWQSVHAQRMKSY